eukprot:185002_1
MRLLTGHEVVGLLVGVASTTAVLRGRLGPRHVDGVARGGRLRGVLHDVLVAALEDAAGHRCGLGVVTVGVDAAALVGALGLGGVPLELILAHQLLHRVSADVLAVEAALADAGLVADAVALVLGEVRGRHVVVAGHGVKE